MQLVLDPNSVDSYRQFLAIKRLPIHHIRGRLAWFPDEYAAALGVAPAKAKEVKYTPTDGLFDYQGDISGLAIRKRKFSVFAEPGKGKTLMGSEFGRVAARENRKKPILWLSPPMVIQQTIDEITRFYGGSVKIERIPSSDLGRWLATGSGIGITNYEALRNEVEPGRLAAMILDESSILKSHYGVYGRECLRLGRGVEWKLCLTGTPAPNDRIEYANHAVFMDAFPTVNAFLATFFVNRGQTDNRWELKPHALRPFYRALSHWSIFLSDPAVYGWKDNIDPIPPIVVHIEHIPLTGEQRQIVQDETGMLVPVKSGGITSRGKLGQIAKGHLRGRRIATNKPEFIRERVASWSDSESTLIWCKYDAEQDSLEKVMPEAGSISGKTKESERLRLIGEFKAGRLRTLISKPEILGFGLNLQIATRMGFSGLEDSYEKYFQAVKRANRTGSTKPLNVHIWATDIEMPMIENVLRKADRVDADTREQEELFRGNRYVEGI